MLDCISCWIKSLLGFNSTWHTNSVPWSEWNMLHIWTYEACIMSGSSFVLPYMSSSTWQDFVFLETFIARPFWEDPRTGLSPIKSIKRFPFIAQGGENTYGGGIHVVPVHNLKARVGDASIKIKNHKHKLAFRSSSGRVPESKDWCRRNKDIPDVQARFLSAKLVPKWQLQKEIRDMLRGIPFYL